MKLNWPTGIYAYINRTIWKNGIDYVTKNISERFVEWQSHASVDKYFPE